MPTLLSGVRWWHKCEVPTASSNVRYQGQPGRHLLALSSSQFDPDVWSGRALQEVSSSWRSAVLHQCIRSLIGAVLLRTNMDISARAISLTDRPQRGHVGHQGSHAPGRPILNLFSFSRRPRRGRDVGYVIHSSSLRAVPFFWPHGRSFFPASARRPAPRPTPPAPPPCSPAPFLSPHHT